MAGGEEHANGSSKAEHFNGSSTAKQDHSPPVAGLARKETFDFPIHPVRTLEATEQIRLCRAIGAIGHDEETMAKNISYRNLPDGLYKRILHSRRKSEMNFYICSAIYSTCVVLQGITFFSFFWILTNSYIILFKKGSGGCFNHSISRSLMR